MTSLGSTILRKHLDEVPLWRGDHAAVRQLVEDFARYLYLPRVAGPEVLAQAMRDGLALLTWQTETFAYAETFDEAAGRYRGLRGGPMNTLDSDDAGMLVKPDVARRQLDAELPPPAPQAGESRSPGERPDISPKGDSAVPLAPEAMPRRFYGTVRLDPARVGRDAGRVAEEVLAHLAGQPGAAITVMLEIEARLPAGASEHTVRTVTENSRTLRFTTHGFETD